MENQTDRELGRQLHGNRPQSENQTRAADELVFVEELKRSQAFQWFLDKYVHPLAKEHLGALVNKQTPADDLETHRDLHNAYHEIKTALLHTELYCRKTLNERDPELPKLRKELLKLSDL